MIVGEKTNKLGVGISPPAPKGPNMDMYVYFRKKYPEMFKGKSISFGCGEGWTEILDTVFSKTRRRGIKIVQMKEKFGGLRLYVDAYEYRISLDDVLGIKDGKVVGKEIPGADVLICFTDSTRVDEFSEPRCGEYYYQPSVDKFYVTQNKSPLYDEEIASMKEIEFEDKDYVKGRLAQLTGLVEAEPIEEEKTSDIIDWAEAESYKVCEQCGTREDVTVEGSWIKTLCKKCRANPDWIKEKKFEKASDDLIEEFRPYVDKILEAIDFSEAMVTDESTLYDFTSVTGTMAERYTERDTLIEKLRDKLGIDVNSVFYGYVFEIAEALKLRDETEE